MSFLENTHSVVYSSVEPCYGRLRKGLSAIVKPTTRGRTLIWISETQNKSILFLKQKKKTETGEERRPCLLTLPPPGVCFKLSLEPQRDWMLEKSTFLSRIWICRERERKEEIVFRKDKHEAPQERG